MDKIGIMWGENFWVRIPLKDFEGKDFSVDDIKELHAVLESGYGYGRVCSVEMDVDQASGLAVWVAAQDLRLGTYSIVIFGRLTDDTLFRLRGKQYVRLVGKESQADAERSDYKGSSAYYVGDGEIITVLGREGLSAYEIAVLHGFEGDEAAWLESLKGDKGDTGEKGDKGDTGEKGDKGDTGEKGDTGATGPQGPQGNSGYQGAVGELEVVNNLVDGGEAAALSAEMGKKLSENLQDVEEWCDNEIFDLFAAVLAEYNATYITHTKTENGGRWTASANNTSGNTLYMTIPRLNVGKRYKIKFDYTSTASITNILLGRLPLIVGSVNRVYPTPYQYLKRVGGVPETGQIDADIYCDNAYVQYITFTIPATNRNQYVEISNISIIPYSDIKDILAESQYGDFEIADPMGNILALFRNGHIMTRNFNSENLNGSILSKFKGKKIAIVGDSISTYQGWLPSDVPGFVGTAYATYYPHGNVDRVEKTWWYQMAENLGLDPATAIANTSWSGGVVCGDSTSTTNGKPSCSTKRISDIAIRGFVPDVIIIFISCNDWYQCGLSGYNTILGDWTIKDPIPAEGTVFKFRNAYALMLAKIRQTYPLSRVFCCTNLDDYRRDGVSDDDTDNAWPPNDAAGITIAEWNNNIREIAEAFACDVINIHDCGITYFNIQQNYAVDAGLHPNAAGMSLIAQKVTSELISKY